MDIISQLHRNALHDVAHYKAYLERYHKDSLTLIDHYRHLRQLLPIYQLIESLMKTIELPAPLPTELNFLLERSKEIESDLAFLAPHVPAMYRDEITNSTQQYCDYLNTLDKNDVTACTEIFIHYLIRILGDLFGGQGLKKCVLDLYKHYTIFPTENEEGVKFYCFGKNTLKDFAAWLRQIEVGKDELDKFGTSAYQKNIAIFDELEATRMKLSQTQNYCNLFKKAAVVGTAALVTGAVLATTYTRFTL